MREFDYWYLGFVMFSTAFFCTVFIVIHSHVWVRGGYEGLNKKLELHEVDRFVAHITSEFCSVVLYIMCMLEPLLKHHSGWHFPIESKVFFASGFVGSGLYIALKHRVKSGINKEQ